MRLQLNKHEMTVAFSTQVTNLEERRWEYRVMNGNSILHDSVGSETFARILLLESLRNGRNEEGARNWSRSIEKHGRWPSGKLKYEGSPNDVKGLNAFFARREEQRRRWERKSYELRMNLEADFKCPWWGRTGNGWHTHMDLGYAVCSTFGYHCKTWPYSCMWVAFREKGMNKKQSARKAWKRYYTRRSRRTMHFIDPNVVSIFADCL